ncbi:hypothetical protein, partial [Pluralibacter gergoviae]|uniref:hypothetical protein n=1 Tax=Pluralibacter gergoviae TaxID=61647 RepID=UPI000A74E33A
LHHKEAAGFAGLYRRFLAVRYPFLSSRQQRGSFQLTRSLPGYFITARDNFSYTTKNYCHTIIFTAIICAESHFAKDATDASN